MIELLGVAITGEMLIALGVAFAIDELLPFLPVKYNGIAHAIILGIKKAKIGKRSKPELDQKIERVLSLMEKWDRSATEITNTNERGR